MTKVDGFDDCVLGTVHPWNCKPTLVYSSESIIKKLIKRDSMTREQAVEFFEYNIDGAYVGEDTPLFLSTIPEGYTLDEWSELLES